MLFFFLTVTYDPKGFYCSEYIEVLAKLCQGNRICMSLGRVDVMLEI
jgi:hypothetical protein